MAYTSTTIQQITPGGISPRMWLYSTADSIAIVTASGYFNNASSFLTVRDIIFICDTVTPTTNICSILSNAGGIVDLSDGTPLSEANSG